MLSPPTRKTCLPPCRTIWAVCKTSLEYSSVDEVVTPEGQKLQFLHSGEIMVQRPDKLYAIRSGAAGTAKCSWTANAHLFAKNANAYLQIDAASIDAAIDAVHKIGFDAPGADLLAPSRSTVNYGLTSGAYIGETFIDGVEVHQLAFRGANVDWQLWVMAGENRYRSDM